MPRKPSNDPVPTVAVVVPCYREVKHVLGVLAGIGPEVAHVIVVDDACPDGTGAHVRDHCADPRVEVITHDVNRGVGGATISGYRRAMSIGADIVVKIDGDGQMDPAFIATLVAPIREGNADYVKGNRFYDLDGVSQMPHERIVGNLVLSFATKMSSGYWDVFDPTNGFTAVHVRVLARLPLDKISAGFFFESDMLFRLNVARAVRWYESMATGVPATAGTVILAALPILLGWQMLLAFFNFDTRNVLTAPLHPRLPPPPLGIPEGTADTET